MNRILLTALLVATAITSNVSADHLDVLRHQYDLNRSELRNEYRARLDANEFAYRRDRDSLLAERRAILRIDCHETRARRLRAVNLELSAIAREKAIHSRAITKWFTNANRSLRNEYEFARKNARRRPVVIVNSPLHAHPDDCICDVCRPPVPVVPIDECAVGARRFDVGYGADYGVGYNEYSRDPVHKVYREVSHRHERRGPNGLDIASIILSLLNN